MCKLYDSKDAKKRMKQLGIKEPKWTWCEKCRVKVHIGDHPICHGQGKFGGHDPIMSYHPFIAFYDMQLGRQINSLKDWNRAMKETGFELADSKHDRERPPAGPSVKGFDKHFNQAMREHFGGVLPVGNFLTEED